MCQKQCHTVLDLADMFSNMSPPSFLLEKCELGLNSVVYEICNGKSGENPCIGLGCGTPTNFKDQKL